VGTTAARYQNLSLNPTKLNGQCGRLKCCLNYELDTYIQELVDIPRVEKSIQTEQGEAFLVKTDIFKKKMWFAFRGDHIWHELPTTRVAQLLEMNKQGIKPTALSEAEEMALAAPVAQGPINHDLRTMDERFRTKERREKNERRQQSRPPANRRPGGPTNGPAGTQAGPTSQGPSGLPRPDGQPPKPRHPRPNRGRGGNRPAGGGPKGVE
jgi:hypothetical protein